MLPVENNTRVEYQQIEKIFEVLDNTTDSYYFIMDFNADCFTVSEKALERFMFPEKQFYHIIAGLEQVIVTADVDNAITDLKKVMSGKQTYHNMEYRLHGTKGQHLWVKVRGAVFENSSETSSLMIGTISEIGEQQTADNVTGLRRETRFAQDWDVTGWEDVSKNGFILRLGIDNFKEINEKNGFQTGDKVLGDLAGILISSVPASTRIYRMSLDQFIIYDFNNGTESDARNIYENIQNRIVEQVRLYRYEMFYTVSAGLLVFPYPSNCYQEISKISEFALNQAKRKGKNRLELFHKEEYCQYLKKLDIQKKLRTSVSNGYEGFEVFYQPIVEGKDYRVIGAEALIRWKNEEIGELSPVEFVPLMEESGLIIPVGRWILQKAFAVCKTWQSIIPHFKINVNLSYIQFNKSNVFEDLKAYMIESGIDPESVVLELTESGYVETDSKFRQLLKEMNDYRIFFAIDDFGTGYSNLRYLKDMNATLLKIDRTFTIKAIENEYDFRLLKSIVDMAHNSGLAVCLEGVEEKEDMESLRVLGSDYIQGFLFGRPAPEHIFRQQYM